MYPKKYFQENFLFAENKFNFSTFPLHDHMTDQKYV